MYLKQLIVYISCGNGDSRSDILIKHFLLIHSNKMMTMLPNIIEYNIKIKNKRNIIIKKIHSFCTKRLSLIHNYSTHIFIKYHMIISIFDKVHIL